MSASLIGRLGSSTFRLSTTSVSMSLTGSRFFSNRPSRVKHFQAIHHFSVDVAHGLALLFGLGTRALPSWDSKTRWNNLLRDLAVEVAAGSSGHTNSPHPSSREGHHSTVGWISGFLLFDLIRAVLMLRRPPWSTGSQCRQ